MGLTNDKTISQREGHNRIGDRRLAVENGRKRRYLPSSSSLRVSESQLTESDMNRTRSALLEEKIAAQHREIQSILTDNQKLALAHLGVKDQLNLAKRELARLLEAAAAVKSDTEAKVREVYQNSLRMEAEARVVNGIGAELDQVRSDVQRLAEDRQKLTTERAGDA
ncbi:hypothetical protein HID58_091529 [Brassica napus]|uniref:Uncharacterized protein n=1 Tax=Brassica napus TaxID=3708 RepID=A0ABQ7WZZ4_BRANA|nr:hypothetical protein HID58_091529 [Brassica napus]